MTGHVFAKCTQDATGFCGGCRTEGMDCMYDALALCVVCGALEGALLPVCPGVELTTEQHDANYKKYCDRIGPFASCTKRTIGAAKDACYFRLHPEPSVSTSLGARALYDAVCTLWVETFAAEEMS